MSSLALRLSACLWLVVSAARAEGDSVAAEALFDEGKRLITSGDLEKACARLAESQKLDPAVGTLLHLADCRERRGQLATAWATFREAASLAHAKGQSDREKKAKGRADALEKRLTFVTIQVGSAGRPPGLVVSRDGVPVSEGLYGVAIPVDPGSHEITATAPGYQPWKQVSVVGDKPEQLTVSVPTLSPEKAAAVAPPPPVVAERAPSPPPASRPPSESPPAKRVPTAAWVLGGVGAASLVAGGYFGARAFSKWGQRTDHCDAANSCDADGLDRIADAKKAANLSTVLVAIGVVGVGAGTTLYVMHDPAQPRAGAIVGARGAF